MSELPDDAILKKAARESGLWAEYASDPVLRCFYMKKLLKRSWAGERSQTEKKYCSLVYHAGRENGDSSGNSP